MKTIEENAFQSALEIVEKLEQRLREDPGDDWKEEFVNLRRDLATLRLVQRSRAEDESLHQTVLSNVSDAVFVTNFSGDFVFVCPNVHIIFGVPSQNVWALSNIKKLLVGLELDASALVKEGDELSNLECSFERHDGKRVFLLVNVRRVGLFGGALLYSCRNVTERRAAEQALAREQKRFQTIADAVDEGLFDYYPQKNELWVSQRWYAMFGYEVGELRVDYDAWRSLLVPDEAQKIEKELLSLIRSGEPWRIEYQMKTKSGGWKWILARGKCVEWSDGKPHRVVGAIVDIDELKKVQENLREAKQRAEQLKKQAQNANLAKSEFLANMSHEIRTPMNGIVGIIDLLSDGRFDEQEQRLFSSLRQCADSMMALLNDILDLSKIEAGKLSFEKSAFDLFEEATGVCGVHRAKANHKEIQLEAELGEVKSLWVNADPVRFRQVLGNLISNAIKFTDRGTVRIRAANLDHSAPTCPVRFEVEDTGIGIDDEAIGRLFEPFEQSDSSTTRKYGGTGLGLSICKRLVQMMDGRIGCRSQLGKGSTFWFEIPFDKLSEDQVNRERQSLGLDLKERGVLGSQLLLVEDNPTNQLVAQRLLKKLGMTVSVAQNGAEALEMVRRHSFQLILMDVQMPIMDGIDATKHIRRAKDTATSRSVPIVAMTAHAYESDKKRCLDAGMSDYVTKPISGKSLKSVLLKWL